MKPLIGYSLADIKKNTSLYSYYTKNGEYDGWDDRDKYGNFKQLVDVSSFAKRSLRNASILDIGCGTGDFAGFLRAHDIKSYLGLDIFKPAVKIATEKYPKETFIYTDFLTWKTRKQFDFVFFSGALATKLNTDNHRMLEAFLKKMWKVGKVGIACNFLIEDPSFEKEDSLFFYDLKKVIEICDQVAPQAKLKIKRNKVGDNFEFLQAHVYLWK